MSKTRACAAVVVALFACAPITARQTARGGGFVPPEPLAYADHEGWTSIFDGSTLGGWDGNPAVWSVENGAITAVTTPERRVASTFIIWQGGELADFELKLEIKAEPEVHSGVFYRSAIGPNAPRTGARAGGPAAGPAAPGAAAAAPARNPAAVQVPADPRWNLAGYGLDFDYDRANGGNVETSGLARADAEIAWRGGIVRAETGKRPRYIGSVGDRDALADLIKVGDWNELHIIARGAQLTHIVNGHVMAILLDDDATVARAKGVIGLQIESFGAGRVSFRNIWLKRL